MVFVIREEVGNVMLHALEYDGLSERYCLSLSYPAGSDARLFLPDLSGNFPNPVIRQFLYILQRKLRSTEILAQERLYGKLWAEIEEILWTHNESE
jgi:hypothetical protein